MPEIAVVAALERELWPLIRRWQQSDREYFGRHFRFFETEGCVVVCGGVGSEAARRAAEAVIALYGPAVVQSVGFAGALEPHLRVGSVLELRCVVDAADGSRTDTGSGSGVLVTFGSVAGAEQKAKLAKAYGAQLVDMEAAAVARSAQAHGLRFGAIKVVSDDVGFSMPNMEKFVGSEGTFQSWKFAAHAAFRPWLWRTVMHLGRNSAKAARALSEAVKRKVEGCGLPSATFPVLVSKDGTR
jgi:adenosylhomocysteine nucleosidase